MRKRKANDPDNPMLATMEDTGLTLDRFVWSEDDVTITDPEEEDR